MIEYRHFDSSLIHTRQQQCRFHSLSRCSRHHSHEPLCPACSRLSSPPSPTTIPTGTYQTFQSLCTAPPPTSASKTRSSRSSLAISACRPCARKPQDIIWWSSDPCDRVASPNFLRNFISTACQASPFAGLSQSIT